MCNNLFLYNKNYIKIGVLNSNDVKGLKKYDNVIIYNGRNNYMENYR